MKKVICDKCGFEISSFYFKQHYRVCSGQGPANRKPKPAATRGVNRPESIEKMRQSLIRYNALRFQERRELLLKRISEGKVKKLRRGQAQILLDLSVCSECGQRDCWNGKPLTLQVDHIDGNRMNNQLENLRVLCPNCHTQTHTWGNKLSRRYS
jgi:5-methylcytosine-specific restriction endonuclease McrA